MTETELGVRECFALPFNGVAEGGGLSVEAAGRPGLVLPPSLNTTINNLEGAS